MWVVTILDSRGGVLERVICRTVGQRAFASLVLYAAGVSFMVEAFR